MAVIWRWVLLLWGVLISIPAGYAGYVLTTWVGYVLSAQAASEDWRIELGGQWYSVGLIGTLWWGLLTFLFAFLAVICLTEAYGRWPTKDIKYAT